MSSEVLNFAVTVSGTYWDRSPQFSILIDGVVVIDDARLTAADQAQTFNFTHELTEGDHTLGIHLKNKTTSDTVTENGEIVKDMLLNIVDITIDDMSIGELLWDAEYLLDQKQWYMGQEIDHLDSCVNLGWNGTHQLTFSSPFYIWLLEQM